MTRNQEEVLRILRYELNFLEQGGYRRLPNERGATSPFRDSMLCLNYGDPTRPHACRECTLFDFVPEEKRTEDAPCHHVPLTEAGETISSLLAEGRKSELESMLKVWLRRTIMRLESELAESEHPVAP